MLPLYRGSSIKENTYITNYQLKMPCIYLNISYLRFFPHYCLGVKDEFSAFDIIISKQYNSYRSTVELRLFPARKIKKTYIFIDLKKNS